MKVISGSNRKADRNEKKGDLWDQGANADI